MTKRKTYISPVQKRSIVINGHKTSVSLETAFWNSLKRIQQERNRGIADPEERMTLGALVAEIDSERLFDKRSNLSSALRLHVVDWLAAQAGLSDLTTEMAHG